MPKASNPTNTARETLKLLASRRLVPTPENYRQIYLEISGEPPVAEHNAEQALRKVLQQFTKDNPAQEGIVSVLEKAVEENNWKGFEAALSRLGGQKTEQKPVPWAELIRELIKQWGLKQSGLNVARKREGLERVLINFSADPMVLHQKLQALINSWAGSPVQQGVPVDSDIPTSAEALVVAQENVGVPAGSGADLDVFGPESFGQLREMLVHAIEMGVLPRLEHSPDLASSARALVQLAATVQDRSALTELSAALKQFWIKLELRGDTDTEVMDGLLRLLRLLVDNIGELVLDDQWLRGQIAVVQDIISRPLNPRVLYEAECSFKEVIFKQGALKHSLNEAKATLKSLMATFIDRLGEMTNSTTEYHQKIELYSQKISQTEDINQLNQLLAEVLRDTKGMQLDMLRSRDELEEARKRVMASEEKVHSLEVELDKVTAMVHEDHLTGSLNRRGMEEAFGREFARAERAKQPVCVALLDIDHFKRINDSYGHDAGDEALIHLVKVVKQTLRPTDVIARFGGEEFVIILPGISLAEGVKAMTRLQRELTKKFFLHKNERLLITFSAGVALRSPDETVDAIIGRADRALYQAKQAGRNRVFAAD